LTYRSLSNKALRNAHSSSDDRMTVYAIVSRNDFGDAVEPRRKAI